MKHLFQILDEEIELFEALADQQELKTEADAFVNRAAGIQRAKTLARWGLQEYCERQLRTLRSKSYTQCVSNMASIQDQGKKELLEDILKQLEEV